MNVSDYYGELVVTGGLTPRWRCWFVSMISVLYLASVLVISLGAATNAEDDKGVKG